MKTCFTQPAATAVALQNAKGDKFYRVHCANIWSMWSVNDLVFVTDKDAFNLTKQLRCPKSCGEVDVTELACGTKLEITV